MSQTQPPVFQLWKDLVLVIEQPQYATTLVLLHSIYQAYFFRQSASYEPNRLLRSIFACCLIGLGGGSMAAILSAKPVGWLTNNHELLIYASGFLIVCGNPFVFPIMKSLKYLTEGLLDIIDVILRAQCMAAFQTNLRLASPQTTTIPQIVLGTISITGGGILFSWCFNAQQRFQYPGHDFTVVVLTNIFYAFNAHPLNRKVLYETLWGTLPMQRLKALGYEKNVLHAYRMAMAFVVDCVKPLGVPVTFKGKKGEMDLRILCAGVMLVGFLVRPGRFTGWLKKKEKPQTGLHVVDEEVDEDASRPIVQ